MSTLTILNSDYDAFDALLHSIYEKTQSDNWFKPVQDSGSTGVALRVSSGTYRVFPYDTPSLLPFEAAVKSLTPNPTVAVKLRSASVHAALSRLSDTESVLEIDVNTRIQVIDELDQLRVAEKEQCQAFLRRERSLVMWSYDEDPEGIVNLWKDFEDKLIKYIWRTRGQPKRAGNTPGLFAELQTQVQEPPLAYMGNPNHPYAYYNQTQTQGTPHSYPPSLPSTAPPTPGFGSFPRGPPPPRPPGSSSGSSTGGSSLPAAAFVGPFGMEAVSDREEIKRHLEFGDLPSSSDASSSSSTNGDKPEETPAPAPTPQAPSKNPIAKILGWWKLDSPVPPSNEKGSTGKNQDIERREAPQRKLVLLGPFYAGFGAGLAMCE